MRKTLTLTAVLALVLAFIPTGAQASFPEPPLVIHELTPCTLFDTRPSQGGTGALAGGEARTFHVVGSTSDFAGQGGNPGGCGIPGFSGGSPQTEMVFLNLVSVDPAGGGNLRVWATDVAEPAGGVLNYQQLTPNLNNANALVVGVRKDVEGDDITVRANVSGTHVRGVALGYLTRGEVSFWSLEGNSGTDPAMNFVGTTDNQPLNFRVNDQRAFRLEAADVPNVVGGWSGNGTGPGVIGATIGGGGCPESVCGTNLGNGVTADFGTVGGGRANTAGGIRSTVGGGHFNNATATDATVGGGHNNHADGIQATVAGGATNFAVGDDSFIGGGNSNEANAPGAIVVGGGGNVVDAAFSFIGGGVGNHITDGESVIGGGTDNVASNTKATVGGGFTNTASGPQATVAGGQLNQATLSESTVGGGFQNTASGARSTVGGGNMNLAGGVAAPNSTVAGGSLNQATGSGSAIGGGVANQASQFAATVGGGRDNIASGNDSTIGGGRDNDATATNATVAGGELNEASGLHATIGGGSSNQATSGSATVSGGQSNVAGGSATVGGGQSNQANGSHSTIGGGGSNTTTGALGVIGGGIDNVTGDGTQATVGGGGGNVASGVQATVPGGNLNTAAGTRSFAAGRRAKANHDGAFVWADNQDADMASSASDQFIVRAQGNIFFQSDSTLDDQGGFINTTTGAFLSNTGVWTDVSSEDVKEGFAPVESREILEGVVSLPVTSWSYRGQQDVRHIGPVSEDFYARFGVGESPRHLASLDTGGVALAAIQGLHQVVEAQQAEITELREASDGGPSRGIPWLPWVGALAGFVICMALAGRRHLRLMP